MIMHAGIAPSKQKTIFIASVAGLFLELALIRWISCEIRIFAYFKNMVLIACFLGFGIGCLLYRRPAKLLHSALMLLLLCLIIQLHWKPLMEYGPHRISLILAQLPGLMIFKAYDALLTWHGIASLLFAIAWALIIFVVCTIIILPFGQMVASAMSMMPGSPLRAYSINVAGSLAGILLYTLIAFLQLPPVCWFVPAMLLLLLLPSVEKIRKKLLLVTLGLTIVLLPHNTFEETTFWSPYQKIALIKGEDLLVNNIRHQTMSIQPSLLKEKNPPARIRIVPFILHDPGDVLIMGAGTGNDVAAALGAGAKSVTAVEIDPVILDIGKALHPQKPYDDPRVTVVLDDARHFLRTTRQQFDQIIFSVLDSHTALSSFTNVRLDDYIYTVESMEDARTHLKPGGMLSVSFWIEQPYIAARLSQNLRNAFGHEPVSLFSSSDNQSGWRLAFFATGEKDAMLLIEDRVKPISWLKRFYTRANAVVPSTDRWPFLPLSEPHIPLLVTILSVVVFIVCAAYIWSTKPRGDSIGMQVFWLGAAFMLLEVHNVSRLALVFGTTWQVNAWVIGMILSVILVANWTRSRMKKTDGNMPRWVVAGLFGSLALSYFLPLESFLQYSYGAGGFLVTLLMTLPIFFAGILFADAFASSASPAFALGWNILGAVLGGLTESVSFIFGISSLILFAALFYLLAVTWPLVFARRSQETKVAI